MVLQKFADGFYNNFVNLEKTERLTFQVISWKWMVSYLDIFFNWDCIKDRRRNVFGSKSGHYGNKIVIGVCLNDIGLNKSRWNCLKCKSVGLKMKDGPKFISPTVILIFSLRKRSSWRTHSVMAVAAYLGKIHWVIFLWFLLSWVYDSMYLLRCRIHSIPLKKIVIHWWLIAND